MSAMGHPRDALHQEIAKLRAQVEELEAELASLRKDEEQALLARNFARFCTPRWTEVVVVEFLHRQFLTTESIESLAATDEFTYRSAHLVMFYVRKSFKKYGVNFKTHFNRGYEIDRESQARLRALLLSQD